jgi:FKBP-type peptidyl-prolyl cis-trans isomerase
MKRQAVSFSHVSCFVQLTYPILISRSAMSAIALAAITAVALWSTPSAAQEVRPGSKAGQPPAQVRVAPPAQGTPPAQQTPASGDQVEIKTLEDQVAYALGLEIGQGVLADGPDLKPELVARGVLDAMRKATPLLSPEQAALAMDRYLARKIGPEAEKNLNDGEAFLAANKTKQGVMTTPSGLQYSVTQAGKGPSPKATDVVRVNYTGMLLDGKVFDSTAGKAPAEFPVNRVIPGWTEALQKMKVGDKWRLYIPSRLAYGPRGTPGGPIPPFSVLIFDVELLEIVP